MIGEFSRINGEMRWLRIADPWHGLLAANGTYWRWTVGRAAIG